MIFRISAYGELPMNFPLSASLPLNAQRNRACSKILKASHPFYGFDRGESLSHKAMQAAGSKGFMNDRKLRVPRTFFVSVWPNDVFPYIAIKGHYRTSRRAQCLGER